MQGTVFNLKKGLDLPVVGVPQQNITDASVVSSVAVLARDYHGLKPSMMVEVGDKVKLGQLLFTDKRNLGVKFTSPGAGMVSAIHRGARRALQSVVIKLDENEEVEAFTCYEADELSSLDEKQVRENLIDSGLWTAFRTRPYSKVPAIDASPVAIFVNAMDTRPLAADPQVIIAQHSEAFVQGLEILSRLSSTLHLCSATDASLPVTKIKAVQHSCFNGPHPAGLPGTHINFLQPVSQQHQVWTISYQDVIAVAKLFTTGKLFCERIISVAGPMVDRPQLLRTRLGANTDELVASRLKSGDVRIISGSILDGFEALTTSAWLGRYSLQISVLQDGQPRNFLHWVNPTLPWFSVLNVFFRGRSGKFSFTTTKNGSLRAMVPLGTYERVVPLDILPTQLLRSLLVRDSDEAQRLGVLDLDEEDVALCSFVCHSKYEYGVALRATLEQIERDG